jgi:hypothetical protein
MRDAGAARPFIRRPRIDRDDSLTSRIFPLEEGGLGDEEEEPEQEEHQEQEEEEEEEDKDEESGCDDSGDSGRLVFFVIPLLINDHLATQSRSVISNESFSPNSF